MDLPEISTSTRVDMFQCSLCDIHSPMSDLREAMTMKHDQSKGYEIVLQLSKMNSC